MLRSAPSTAGGERHAAEPQRAPKCESRAAELCGFDADLTTFNDPLGNGKVELSEHMADLQSGKPFEVSADVLLNGVPHGQVTVTLQWTAGIEEEAASEGFMSKMVNRFEKVTGLDIDGDGDVGEAGKSSPSNGKQSTAWS